MHVSQALCRALDKCDLLRLVARNGRATPHQSLFQLFQNQNASTKKKEQNLPAEEDRHDAQRVNPPMHRLKFSHRKIFSPSIRPNKSLAWKKTADKRHQKANSTGNLCYCWPILFTSCMSITPFTAKSKAMLPSISMDNQSRKQGGRTRAHKKISNSIAIEANHLCRIQHECVLSVHSGEPVRNRTSADSMPCG